MRFRQRTLVQVRSPAVGRRERARCDARDQRQAERQVRRPQFLSNVSRDALEGLSKKGSEWKESSEEERCRRSIYMFTKRSLLLPLMTVFDFSDTTQPCAQRNVSIVATQALALLNNEFVHAQSDALARRVVAEAGGEVSAQIDRAWWLALGRAPTERERGRAIEHLAAQRERFLNQGARSSGSRRISASRRYGRRSGTDFGRGQRANNRDGGAPGAGLAVSCDPET